MRSRAQVARQICSFLDRADRAWLAVGALALLAASATELVLPPLVASLLFTVVRRDALAAFVVRTGQLLFVAFGFGVLNGIRGYAFHLARNRFLRRLRDQAFTALIRKDMGFHDEVDQSELTARLVGDCQTVFSLLADVLNFLLRSGVVVVGGSILLVSISAKITMNVAVVLLLLCICTQRYSELNRKAAQRTQDELAKLNRIAGEGLRLLRTVRALNAESSHRDMYQAQNSMVFDTQSKRGMALGLFHGANNTLTTLVRAVALLSGSILLGVGNVTLTAEILATYLLYLDLVVDNALELGVEWFSAMEALGCGERVFAIAQYQSEKLVGTQRLAQIKGKIVLHGVSFAYPSRAGHLVLKDVSFCCHAGQTTAIVGPSGSGKSSIVNLTLRMYDCVAGAIKLDGVDLTALDPSWLRRQVGIVCQEPRLFHGTIAANIAWGLPDATEAEVRAAAEAACAHEFIQGLPDAYNTIVADSKLLSGGQRQRIAIARALIRDPPILILDEPTAALDPTASRLVSKALEHARWSPRLGRHRTIVVIAHRLNTVEHADQIVVLQEGRVVERGTHMELMANHGVYTRLVSDQRLPTNHALHI